jgi:hypothetical protein
MIGTLSFRVRITILGNKLAADLADVWFHRYRDGKDIEGRCKLRIKVYV